MNGGIYEKYTDPLKFEKEQDYSLAVYAVDNVGNEENEKYLKFIPDYSAPKTAIELANDFKDNIILPHTKFTLKSKDNLSGIKHIIFNYNDGKNNFY